MTGVIWVVYDLTQSPFLVGLLGVARALPSLILSPIAGVVCDRVDQRLLLFTTQAMGLVVSLWLGILIATGTVNTWEVYVQVIAQAIITAFDASARQVLFPRLVPRAALAEAVTLTITATRVAKLIGPAAGGLLIAYVGVASPFLLNAASFLALMGAVAWMRPLAPRLTLSRGSFFGELGEGLRHIVAEPVMSGLFLMEVVYGIFDINLVAIAIVAREILHVGPQALGFLLASPAFGSFAGIAWLLFAGRTDRQGRFSLTCTLVYSVVLAVVAVSSNYAVTLVSLTVVGALEVLVTVTRNSLMQLAAPEHMRGRVMANMGTITRGIGPLAETQSGTLASAIGPHLGVLAAAIAIGAAAAATARFNRTLWRFSLAAELEEHLAERIDPIRPSRKFEKD